MRSTKRGVRASVDTKAALCYCIFFIVICGEGQLNNGSFCSVLFKIYDLISKFFNAKPKSRNEIGKVC